MADDDASRAGRIALRLRAAREKRGWSYNAASMRSKQKRNPAKHIGTQQLVNLEKGITDPLDVKAKTMLALVELFWPDLELADFTGARSPFRLVATDRRTEQRLRYGGVDFEA